MQVPIFFLAMLFSLFTIIVLVKSCLKVIKDVASDYDWTITVFWGVASIILWTLVKFII